MVRFAVLAATFVGLSAGAFAPLAAAPCRDAHGKFMKCPPAKTAPVRCRNAKGQFAKCGTPGATPTK